MKVLYIINSLATGGAEKLIIETLPLYAKEGVKVDLLLLNGTAHPFLEELASKKCCGIFNLGASSVYNPVNIFKIIPYLKKYDLVHVHLFPAQYWVVLAKLLSFSKTKLIFTEHNTTNRRLENPIFRFIDKWIYQFYAGVIAITAEIKALLLKHTALPEVRFTVIENGVNLSAIQNATALPKTDLSSSIRENDRVIIQIAAFREQKDQKTLIRAMQLLPDFCKLILVGVGPVKIECENLVTELGLQNRVVFLGSRMDVPALLKTADMVVLSSKYEGLSLSSIEGMASGNPFIASEVPGLSEVVKGAGILFPQGDADQLAKEIIHLCTDPDYYRTVAEACQQRAADYDISKMVDKHIALYRSLIN